MITFAEVMGENIALQVGLVSIQKEAVYRYEARKSIQACYANLGWLDPKKCGHKQNNSLLQGHVSGAFREKQVLQSNPTDRG